MAKRLQYTVRAGVRIKTDIIYIEFILISIRSVSLMCALNASLVSQVPR